MFGCIFTLRVKLTLMCLLYNVSLSAFLCYNVMVSHHIIGEAFIPYYTGKAIDGIVVHQTMESFVKPLVILAVLALSR